MLIKKLLKEIKRVFDFLIGDKSDEIYWRYKSFFNSDWRNGYLDLNTDTHPHRKLLLNKLTHLNLINSILEVGCANGINLRMINKKIPGIELEGFDINKKALSEGVNILKRENISNITLKHQSAKNLGSYDTGQFDVVFCDAVLMYIGPNNINQALIMARLLMVLFGFILAMLGIILSIHSEHYVVGLLITFGGVVSVLEGLPKYE